MSETTVFDSDRCCNSCNMACRNTSSFYFHKFHHLLLNSKICSKCRKRNTENSTKTDLDLSESTCDCEMDIGSSTNSDTIEPLLLEAVIVRAQREIELEEMLAHVQ